MCTYRCHCGTPRIRSWVEHTMRFPIFFGSPLVVFLFFKNPEAPYTLYSIVVVNHVFSYILSCILILYVCIISQNSDKLYKHNKFYIKSVQLLTSLYLSWNSFFLKKNTFQIIPRRPGWKPLDHIMFNLHDTIVICHTHEPRLLKPVVCAISTIATDLFTQASCSRYPSFVFRQTSFTNTRRLL